MEVCTTPNLDYGRREDVTAPQDTTLYVSDNQDNLPITLQRKFHFAVIVLTML